MKTQHSRTLPTSLRGLLLSAAKRPCRRALTARPACSLRTKAAMRTPSEPDTCASTKARVGPAVVSDVLFAKGAHLPASTVRRHVASPREPCSPARGGSAACSISASASRRVGRERSPAQHDRRYRNATQAIAAGSPCERLPWRYGCSRSRRGEERRRGTRLLSSRRRAGVLPLSPRRLVLVQNARDLRADRAPSRSRFVAEHESSQGSGMPVMRLCPSFEARGRGLHRLLGPPGHALRPS